MSSGACCAHNRAVRRNNEENGRVTAEWWECDSGCGTKFLPVVVPSDAGREEREQVTVKVLALLGRTAHMSDQRSLRLEIGAGAEWTILTVAELKLLLAAPSSAVEPAGEAEPIGTFACPLCGLAGPHSHTDGAVDWLRFEKEQRALFEARAKDGGSWWWWNVSRYFRNAPATSMPFGLHGGADMFDMWPSSKEYRQLGVEYLWRIWIYCALANDLESASVSMLKAERDNWKARAAAPASGREKAQEPRQFRVLNGRLEVRCGERWDEVLGVREIGPVFRLMGTGEYKPLTAPTVEGEKP